MIGLLIAIASAVVLGGGSPSARSESDFQLTAARTATGWTMQCSRGCDWSQLSLDCRFADCRALVDNAGITTAVRAKPEGRTFAFVIGRTQSGWTAHGIEGTAWADVSWNCPAPSSCRAHLNARGVGGPATP